MERSKHLYRFLYAIVRPFLGLFHRIRVSGLERLPEDAAILCPNHSSFADPLYIFCALTVRRRVYPMAKAELRRIPIVGWLMERVGTIFVDRGAADVKAVKAALQVLKEGRMLLIFPEGTRSRNGFDRHGQLIVPKEGAALLATRTGAPLVPVYLTPKRSVFGTIHVIFGTPYHPRFAERKATAQELKEITSDLMSRIFTLGEGLR